MPLLSEVLPTMGPVALLMSDTGGGFRGVRSTCNLEISEVATHDTLLQAAAFFSSQHSISTRQPPF